MMESGGLLLDDILEVDRERGLVVAGAEPDVAANRESGLTVPLAGDFTRGPPVRGDLCGRKTHPPAAS